MSSSCPLVVAQITIAQPDGGGRFVATSQDARGEGWRQLVTEGHVIAARLRWLQPWFLGTSCAAMVLGFAGAWLTKPAPDYGGYATTGASVVASVRAPAVDAVQRMPALSVPPDQVGAQVPSGEVAQVQTLILQSLQTTGSLPDSQLSFRRVDVATFWQQPWSRATADNQVASITVLDLPTLKLVGTVVKDADDANGGTMVAKRWLGVFSRRNGKWVFASLAAPGLGVIPGLPQVAPADIPLTLAPALPRGGPNA